MMPMTGTMNKLTVTKNHFFEDVRSLVATFEELGNPFLDQSRKLCQTL